MQVGGEPGAHRRPHFLLGGHPERQGALEQGAAVRRGHQLMPALVARRGAFDQAALQQRTADCA